MPRSSILARLLPCSIIPLVTLASLGAAQVTTQAHALAAWLSASSVDGPNGTSVIVFRNGKRFSTGVFVARLVGLLPRQDSVPLVVLAGYDCRACDAERDIYVASPVGGPITQSTKVGYFAPGGGFGSDPSDTTPHYESRMFIGNCLSDTTAITWFARIRVDSASMRSNVRVIDVVDNRPRVRDLRPPLPDVGIAEGRVAAGLCREVSPLETR